MLSNVVYIVLRCLWLGVSRNCSGPPHSDAKCSVVMAAHSLRSGLQQCSRHLGSILLLCIICTLPHVVQNLSGYQERMIKSFFYYAHFIMHSWGMCASECVSDLQDHKHTHTRHHLHVLYLHLHVLYLAGSLPPAYKLQCDPP